MRESQQREWLNNRVNVIVATVAFGMGIDKPDVRFVIHMTLPKSIEAYYQECGRAGRDGEKSICMLFYKIQDAFTLMSLIKTKKKIGMDKFVVSKNNVSENQEETLLAIAKFCENVSDCRQKMIGQHFQEEHPKSCHGLILCDNCDRLLTYSKFDVTLIAQQVVLGLKEALNGTHKFSIGIIKDILKGSKNKQILENCYNNTFLHGLLKNWNRVNIQKLMHQLIFSKYLAVQFCQNSSGYSNGYLILGPDSNKVCEETFSMFLDVVHNSDEIMPEDLE